MNLGYHKIIMDIQNCFWISKNEFKDIHKSIFGHPLFIFGYPKVNLWISLNTFLDIQKLC